MCEALEFDSQSCSCLLYRERTDCRTSSSFTLPPYPPPFLFSLFALTIYSTTQMPKCSFHIVCTPTLARPSHRLSSGNGAPTTNSTCPPIPASAAKARNVSTRLSSSAPRQLPSRTSLMSFLLTRPFLPVPLVLLLLRKRANARIWRGWSFSGRNWPTERMTGSRGAKGKSCEAIFVTEGDNLFSKKNADFVCLSVCLRVTSFEAATETERAANHTCTCAFSTPLPPPPSTPPPSPFLRHPP